MRKNTRVTRSIIIIIIAFLVFSPLPAEEENIDKLAELFAKHADFKKLKISPDKRHLSFLRPVKDKDFLYIIDLANKKGIHLIPEKSHKIFDYHWVDNENLVYSLSKWDVFFYRLYRINKWYF